MSGDVQAVVFDIGRVLVEWELRHLYGKLIEDERQLDWFLANVVTEEWHAEHDAGRPLEEMVVERKRQYPRYASLIDFYAERFAESIPGPVPGTHELVEALSARGVPLFAITNFAAGFWDEFRAANPVLDHFRDIVVSGIEKVAKPDPGIFRLAERRFGIVPGDTLFVDDNGDNIETAQSLGWNVHHFTDAKRLSDDLRGRGLLP